MYRGIQQQVLHRQVVNADQFQKSIEPKGEGNEFSTDESERTRKNMAVIMASKSNISRSTTWLSRKTTTDTSKMYSEEDYDEDIDGSQF